MAKKNKSKKKSGYVKKTRKKTMPEKNKKRKISARKKQHWTEKILLPTVSRLLFISGLLIFLWLFSVVIPHQEKTKIKVNVLHNQKVIATAYSSTVDQTDSTPCITANGYNLCKYNRENVIAANFLPLNTKVRIPELFGEEILTVRDRMNPRYGKNRIDVWLTDRAKAKNFGVRILDLEIVDVEE